MAVFSRKAAEQIARAMFAQKIHPAPGGDESLEPSHVLKAMGIPFISAHGSIRFSLSRFNSEAEVDYAAAVMPQIIEKLRSITPFNQERKTF